MQSIFGYFGAKWSWADWIISHFPPRTDYDAFIDVFGGSAAVIANAPQVDLNVFNDLDKEICNLFNQIRNNLDELLFKIAFTTYSLTDMEETYDVERRGALIETDPVEAARLFYVRSTQTFGGYKHNTRGWARAIAGPNGKITNFNNLDKFIEFSAICKTWQIDNEPYEEIIKRYNKPSANGKPPLFYFDPPYLVDVCAPGRGRTYRYDLKSAEEHEALLKQILRMGDHRYALISGYDSDLYNDILKGWGREVKDGGNVARKSTDGGESFDYEYVDRQEVLWISPSVLKARNRPLQVGLFAGAFEEEAVLA